MPGPIAGSAAGVVDDGPMVRAMTPVPGPVGAVSPVAWQAATAAGSDCGIQARIDTQCRARHPEVIATGFLPSIPAFSEASHA